jgi:hypothetical protein
MSNQDGKLIATAMGAAAAGATLAVMAMKMIESKNEKSFYNNNNNIGGGGGGGFNNHNNNNNNSSNMLDSGLGASNTNLLAYHADENRPIRPTVIMNDPSDLVGDHHADSSFNVASAGASQYVDIAADFGHNSHIGGVPGVGVAGGLPPGNMRRDSSEAMLFPHNHEEKMRRRIATRYTIEEENNLGRDSVTVRVPATSANVGPGCKLLLFFKTNKPVHCEEFQNPNMYPIPHHPHSHFPA